jgi:hypothetical protein
MTCGPRHQELEHAVPVLHGVADFKVTLFLRCDLYRAIGKPPVWFRVPPVPSVHGRGGRGGTGLGQSAMDLSIPIRPYLILEFLWGLVGIIF